MTRLELATPRPPDVCATKLRYIPMQRYYYSNSFSVCQVLIFLRANLCFSPGKFVFYSAFLGLNLRISLEEHGFILYNDRMIYLQIDSEVYYGHKRI